MKYFKKEELAEVHRDGKYWEVELFCGASILTDSVTLGEHYGYLPDDAVVHCKQGCDPCILLDYESPAE